MKFKNLLSKQNVVDSLTSLTKLAPKIDHNTLLTISALSLILFISFAIRMFPIRWEIPKGGMHLSEFDPYFQYRFTEYMVKKGFISWAWPEQWHDPYRWYPRGLNIATHGFPGLPFTAASLYSIISALGANVRLMDFCAIFPPVMGMLACLVVFFLGKDFGGRSVGLLASLFLALSPSYIQRTALGFFDGETIGVLALSLFLLLFLRAIEKDRPLDSTVKYALASGTALGYFCSSWGAAFYPIGVGVLFVFLLILFKRYTRRLLLSYSLTFGLALFIAINVPKLASAFLTEAPIIAVLGVFLLLCLNEIFKGLKSTKWKIVSIITLLAILICGFIILWQLGYMQRLAGKFFSVVDPLARGETPIIESVAEHRISAWGSIYYELGIGVIFFLVGLFFVLRDLNDKNLALLISGLTSVYFACSMVRLLVLMAPIFSVLAAVGIIGVLKPFSTLLREPARLSLKRKHRLQSVGKEFSGAAVFLIFLVLMTNFAFPMPKVYSQAWSPVTITASSLPIAPTKPVHEWLDMLSWTKSNLEATTVVCSWWDYGYWLTVLGNVTSLADNGTVNLTQIENIGFTFMSNETQALKMLKKYDADYILVFTTFDVYGRWIGYGDEGKWSWMARISGKSHNRLQCSWTDESDFGFFNGTSTTLYPQGRWQWNLTGMQSTIYKLMAWGKHRWCENTIGSGSDPEQLEWPRNNLTVEDIQPEYFEEAYFAGVNLSTDEAKNYGNIIPLVCLYEIDWEKYDSDYPSE